MALKETATTPRSRNSRGIYLTLLIQAQEPA